MRINRHKQVLLAATKGDSVVIELEKDIDASRGNQFALSNQALPAEKSIESKICWLNTTPLNLHQKYMLQHGAFTTQAKITAVNSQLDFNSLNFEPMPKAVGVNSINEITLKTAAPLHLDSFKQNANNGSFILIDPSTNATVAVGFKS